MSELAGGPKKKKKKSLLGESLGLSFLMFALVAASIGALVWLQQGAEVATQALASSAQMYMGIFPNFMGAIVIAAFVPSLIPRAFMEKIMGEESGLKGMTIATGAAMVTPGGPMTSFPLLLALRKAGAGVSPLVTYVTAWSTMGLQRILIWEMPLLGVDFAIVRLLSSAPLGFLAGFLCRFFPIEDPAEEDPQVRTPPRP